MVALMRGVLFLTLLVFSHAVLAGYGAKICDTRLYQCYHVKRGDSWDTLYPNSAERDLVMRINRMNTRLHPGMEIAIPSSSNDEKVATNSPLPLQISAPGTRFIHVSLSKLAFGAYDSDGSLIYWGPVSGGQDYCPDVHRRCHSPTGHFTIYRKEGAGCFSTKFPVGRGGAKMPYCMFFRGGFALHGSYEVPGYNASHGCVRMFIDDARWLNQEFTNYGTPVIIEY